VISVSYCIPLSSYPKRRMDHARRPERSFIGNLYVKPKICQGQGLCVLPDGDAKQSEGGVCIPAIEA
jgi:hypothetical protein